MRQRISFRLSPVAVMPCFRRPMADDRADRIRVYEQVLREGTEDDVCRAIASSNTRDALGARWLTPAG